MNSGGDGDEEGKAVTADWDGHVVRVAFYRGELLLGESDGSEGWTWTGDTTGWEPGQVTLQAYGESPCVVYSLLSGSIRHNRPLFRGIFATLQPQWIANSPRIPPSVRP